MLVAYVCKLAHLVVGVLATISSRRPQKMSVCRGDILGHNSAGNYMVTRTLINSVKCNEHIKMVIWHEALILYVQRPRLPGNLLRLALNGNRPRSLLIRGNDVNAARVPKRNRRNIAAT